METVTIQVGSTWAKVARSPLYWIVVALQGVSVTFAPLFLYWSGKGILGATSWLVVPLCFAVIFCVPVFNFHFSGRVIEELRRPRATT